MKYAILALLLAGCAETDLQAIHTNVWKRLDYSYYHGWDMRYLPNGGTGNCSTFAYNYAIDAMKDGHKARVLSCRLKDGDYHAYALVDDKYVLDNRMASVVERGQNGCE